MAGLCKWPETLARLDKYGSSLPVVAIDIRRRYLDKILAFQNSMPIQSGSSVRERGIFRCCVIDQDRTRTISVLCGDWLKEESGSELIWLVAGRGFEPLTFGL